MILKGMPRIAASEMAEPLKKLSELPLGTHATIRSIGSEEIRVGLLNLGVSEGENVILSDAAPLGGPIAFKLHGTKVALRLHDASQILVEVTE